MVIRHDLYELRSLMGYAALNLEEVKLVATVVSTNSAVFLLNYDLLRL